VVVVRLNFVFLTASPVLFIGKPLLYITGRGFLVTGNSYSLPCFWLLVRVQALAKYLLLSFSCHQQKGKIEPL